MLSLKKNVLIVFVFFLRVFKKIEAAIDKVWNTWRVGRRNGNIKWLDIRLQHLSLPFPLPGLASELQWLLHPYLNTLPTFFFAGLFEGISVPPKYVHSRLPLKHGCARWWLTGSKTLDIGKSNWFYSIVSRYFYECTHGQNIKPLSTELGVTENP